MLCGSDEPVSLRTFDFDSTSMFPECIECRGTKGMCGIAPCPLLVEVRGRLPQRESISVGELSAPSPPSLFVGRYGYPEVRAGPSASWIPEDAQSDDATISGDPAKLFGRPLEEVAARHEVNLKAAASQFVFAHPAITCIIPGTRQPDRVSENFGLLTEEIPADFWTELKSEGLVRADAPLPS